VLKKYHLFEFHNLFIHKKKTTYWWSFGKFLVEEITQQEHLLLQEHLLQLHLILLLRSRHRRKMRRGPTKGCLRGSEDFSSRQFPFVWCLLMFSTIVSVD
jgi:hypothetical protein